VGSVFAEEEDTRNKNLLLKREKRTERPPPAILLGLFLLSRHEHRREKREKRERKERERDERLYLSEMSEEKQNEEYSHQKCVFLASFSFSLLCFFGVFEKKSLFVCFAQDKTD